MSLRVVAPLLGGNLGPVLQTRLPLGALVQAQWRGGVFGRYDLLLRSLVATQLLRPKPPAKPTKEISWYQGMQQARAGRDTLQAFRDLARAVREVGWTRIFQSVFHRAVTCSMVPTASESPWHSRPQPRYRYSCRQTTATF